MAKITAEEYAAIVGRSRRSVYTKAGNGLLKTALKQNGQWLIDENEPWPDGRKTSEAEKVVMATRVCKQCGRRFEGGPRARFCNDCKIERKKANQMRFRQRKRLGAIRKMGEMGICQRCGETFTTRSGNQKYCPSCRDEAYKEVDRQQSLDYYYRVGREKRMTKKKDKKDQ